MLASDTKASVTNLRSTIKYSYLLPYCISRIAHRSHYLTNRVLEVLERDLLLLPRLTVRGKIHHFEEDLSVRCDAGMAPLRCSSLARGLNW